MKKMDEIADPDSCLNKARPEERLFVLLARDPAAPVAIRAWVEERLRLGKNHRHDGQIEEALRCAGLMEKERTAGAGISEQQWDAAVANAREAKAQYDALVGTPGVSVAFALSHITADLDRYANGERTRELYESLLAKK